MALSALGMPTGANTGGQHHWRGGYWDAERRRNGCLPPPAGARSGSSASDPDAAGGKPKPRLAKLLPAL